MSVLKDTISHPAPLRLLPTAGVFERWHMDFLGKLKIGTALHIACGRQ